ncbi:reverse transcriptase [Clostridium sp. KLE 1755]|jgi:RNA-directed DNA polymerase|nr:group II intron reverse transcriptase/maturase [Eisenbergiella massiliensis]ERI71217.1 reverse transcriptase [Clostridium sp. KLE 1755]
MEMEQRGEQSISFSRVLIAEKTTSAVPNRERVVNSSETERNERMDTSSLMEQILSKENLNTAYLQVVRNKGAEGVDEMKYTELKEHLAKNGEIIKEQLRTRKYKPQPVRRVEIPKSDGGVRNLGVPTVTDRLVQQAIAQVLTPIYEEQFHDHSYGFRPNRCAQQAIITALDMMNDGYDWIVDIDLEKFFDTVNHDKLMTLIGKTIKDGDVISIIRKFLVSGIMVDDEYKESVIGTPQGGNLSPLLANIMLNELDKEMEQRGLNFVRYADDCIIMVGSEMSAKRVMRNLTKFIEEKLGLKVNMTKSKVDRPNGLKYLGFGFYFDSRAHQFKAKPHEKSVAKFKTKMKQLTCRSWGVSNTYKVQKLNELIRGWINYFKIGSMKTLCAKMDSNIRYRLRMCIWKHWKTSQNREKNLVKLGIDRNTARRVAYTGARIAYVCNKGAVNVAINNKRLASFGLISMLDYYTERCVTC